MRIWGCPADRRKDKERTAAPARLADWPSPPEQTVKAMRRSPTRAARIRKVQVDQARTIVALGERIAAKQFAQQAGGGAKI